MTRLSCYLPLSDLSRKDRGENVGGEQSTVRGGVQDPARSEEILSLPFRGSVLLCLFLLES